MARDRSGDSNRVPDLNPENFGISQRESRQMQGRAIGEHLFDAVEMIATGEKGGFRNAAAARALEKMRGFPEHMISYDEDNHPTASVTTGNWTSSWKGGHAIDHTHKKHGTLDMTNLTDYSDPNHGPFGPGPSITHQELIAHHKAHLQDVKETYPKEYQ